MTIPCRATRGFFPALWERWCRRHMGESFASIGKNSFYASLTFPLIQSNGLKFPYLFGINRFSLTLSQVSGKELWLRPSNAYATTPFPLLCFGFSTGEWVKFETRVVRARCWSIILFMYYNIVYVNGKNLGKIFRFGMGNNDMSQFDFGKRIII